MRSSSTAPFTASAQGSNFRQDHPLERIGALLLFGPIVVLMISPVSRYLTHLDTFHFPGRLDYCSPSRMVSSPALASHPLADSIFPSNSSPSIPYTFDPSGACRRPLDFSAFVTACD